MMIFWWLVSSGILNSPKIIGLTLLLRICVKYSTQALKKIDSTNGWLEPIGQI